MANTFTTNYSLTRSEIGANNDNWGQDLNDALSSVDSQIVRKVDKTDVVTQTSNKIAFSGNTITGNSSTASTIFQNFQAGDVISIAGATSANNGNHTISSKTNAYTLVTSSSFTTEAEGDNTISYHLVPKYSEVDIDGGTIDGATIATSDITVGSGKTLDVSGGTLTLGSDQITTASIIDDNVTTAKIADSNITTALIADSNVTTAKIADSNVTYAKIQNVTDARILGNNSGSSGVVTELTGANVTGMLSEATTSVKGLMSASDKSKLDTLPTNGFAELLYMHEYTTNAVGVAGAGSSAVYKSAHATSKSFTAVSGYLHEVTVSFPYETDTDNTFFALSYGTSTISRNATVSSVHLLSDVRILDTGDKVQEGPHIGHLTLRGFLSWSGPDQTIYPVLSAKNTSTNSNLYVTINSTNSGSSGIFYTVKRYKGISYTTSAGT